MKKSLFVIMLVVLCLFSFVSCKEDKSEEVIQNYVEFMKVKNLAHWLDNAFETSFEDLPNGTVSVTKSDAYSIANIAEIFLDLGKNYDCSTRKFSSAAGTISGTYTDEDNYDVTFNNVQLTFTLTMVDEDDELAVDIADKVMTINGTLTKSEDGEWASYSCKVTIGIEGYSEKSYNFSYTKNELNYKSALLDGVEIDSRLLNPIVISD